MFPLSCTNAQNYQSICAVKSHSCALPTFDIVYISHSPVETFHWLCVYVRVSNTNCSEGQIRTYKATGGPHYDADATMAVPEPYQNSFYILFLAKYIVSYRQIISSRLYVRLKETCSLAGGTLLNIVEESKKLKC